MCLPQLQVFTMTLSVVTLCSPSLCHPSTSLTPNWSLFNSALRSMDSRETTTTSFLTSVPLSLHSTVLEWSTLKWTSSPRLGWRLKGPMVLVTLWRLTLTTAVLAWMVLMLTRAPLHRLMVWGCQRDGATYECLFPTVSQACRSTALWVTCEEYFVSYSVKL